MIKQTIMAEDFARLFVHRAVIATEMSPMTLRFPPLEILGISGDSQIAKLFDRWNVQAS